MSLKKWTTLKKRIENIWHPSLGMEIHATSFALRGTHESYRYWITMGDEIIWDFPNMFIDENPSFGQHIPYLSIPYYWHNSGVIKENPSNVIAEYLCYPTSLILDIKLKNDDYGLGDLLKAADRRLGKHALTMWCLISVGAGPARYVLSKRFKKV